MSVSATVNTVVDLYVPQPALENPYPVGEWRGVGYCVGDLTGGYVETVFAPVSAEEARKYIWSWEGYSARMATNLLAAIGVFLDLITADPPEGTISTEFYTAAGWMQPSAVTGLTGLSLFAPDRILNKLHRPGRGLTNSFTIRIDGNINTVEYRFGAWGYIWHPQARTNAGGPRRP